MGSQDNGGASSSLIFVCVDESEHSRRAFDWFHDNLYRDEHTIGLLHIYNAPLSQHANKLADVDAGEYDIRREQAKQVGFPLIRGISYF